MSFGFSIGDLLAAGKLIIDITDSLRSVGGAKSEYQEIYGQLEALQDGLRRLDQLAQCDGSSPTLANITKVGQSCQHTLRGFFNKVQRYESSLGIWSKPSRFLGTGAKLRWTFKMKGELQSFQSHLATHIVTINMLLGQYGAQQLQCIKTTSDTQHLNVRQQLQSNATMLQMVQDSVPAQMLALQMVQGSLGAIEANINGDLNVTCKIIQDKVAENELNSRRICELLLELRNHPPAVDTRFTFFQPPFCMNWRGAKFPFPAEYDRHMLVDIVRSKYKSSHGSYDPDRFSENGRPNWTDTRYTWGWFLLVSGERWYFLDDEDVLETLPPRAELLIAVLTVRGAPRARPGESLASGCQTCFKEPGLVARLFCSECESRANHDQPDHNRTMIADESDNKRALCVE